MTRYIGFYLSHRSDMELLEVVETMKTPGIVLDNDDEKLVLIPYAYRAQALDELFDMTDENILYSFDCRGANYYSGTE